MTRPDNLEQAFAEVEREATAALDCTKKLQSLLRQLHKSSREGNVAALKRAQGGLLDAATELTGAIAGAADSWPFGGEEDVEYLRQGYAAELRRVAAEHDLTIHEGDAQLICHPSTVRILPGERAVRIDRKKVSTIRPSHLVALLRENQKRPARSRPEPFLKALHDVYTELTPKPPRGAAAPAAGPVIPLERIYKLLVSLPGSRRDYTRTDFARDIYQLETAGVTATKSGARVSFPASTGTRGPKGLFTFVGPDGREVKYYAIRFATQAD
ncbi:MAG: hypothetical protein OXG55_08405 [bacterium]|nr:hypothetical protein [bacterium]